MSQTITLKWETPSSRSRSSRLAATVVAWVLCGGMMGFAVIALNDPEWWYSFAAATTSSLMSLVLTLPFVFLAYRRATSWGRVIVLIGLVISALMTVSLTLPLAAQWNGSMSYSTLIAVAYVLATTFAVVRR